MIHVTLDSHKPSHHACWHVLESCLTIFLFRFNINGLFLSSITSFYCLSCTTYQDAVSNFTEGTDHLASMISETLAFRSRTCLYPRLSANIGARSSTNEEGPLINLRMDGARRIPNPASMFEGA